MLDDKELSALLRRDDLSHRDKILLLLASGDPKPSSAREIKALGSRAGLRAIRSWRIADSLRAQPPVASLTSQKWVLTADGRQRVAAVLGRGATRPMTPGSVALRSKIQALGSQRTKAFVEEAIGCLEAGFLRAAVVLSWVGAVAVLQEHVLRCCLQAFNVEAARRNAKWKPARCADDLATLREGTFLELLEGISVLGRSVKTELNACLTLRNGCGHPNSLRIGPSRVAAHIETLVLNVFSVY